jgi:hypothetical protein
MATITIPKKLIRNDDLVILPRKEYEEYLELKEKRMEEITEEDILRWSKDAKKLKKAGKLPVLRSLKELR